MLAELLSVAGGLILLIAGADGLVRGSSGLALRMGISTLVVGLTVVAFGTSAPELVVSLKAVLVDNGPIALGNVIGSNIANIALILGLSALVNPIRIQSSLIRRDTPILIAATIILILMLADHQLGRWEGLILLTAFIYYLVTTIYISKRKEDEDVREELKLAVPARPQNVILLLLLVICGLGLLVLGAHLFVQGAVEIARRFALSEAIIGLTLVAVGTSLPELATSLVASLRRKDNITVGNVVGSNLFNILCILGLTLLIRPISIQGFSVVDLGMLLLTSVLILPMLRTGFIVTRREGGFLLLIYILYIGHRIIMSG